MKIILSGGGTLGPVTPLLAIAEAYRKKYPDAKFVWVGTTDGPERELVEKYQIPFFVIQAGKWRRYFSLLNLADVFKLFIAFIQSLVLIAREKPDLLISAGGFVSVPVHWAGALFGIPAWAHQQDARPGLANKLITPFAKKITTALRESARFFPPAKTAWLGNPSRDLSVKDSTASRAKFGISAGAPVVLAMGGGTGSARLNQMVVEALQHWPPDWQVIHLTGRERPRELAVNAAKIFPNYHVYDFFNEEIKDAYAAADVVVARAGFASLTELAALAKAVILLPMAGTHQEDNAGYFVKENAALALDERLTSGLELAQRVKELMDNPVRRELMGKRLSELLPPVEEEKIVEIMDELMRKIG